MTTNKIGDNAYYGSPVVSINKNILRKKPILDRDPQFYNGVPLPSWIELSLIDTCNRSCLFCPKSNDEIAPNTHNKIERSLVDKLYKDLKEINYNGAFSLCGYGEPLLYKDLYYLTSKLSEFGSIEIVTNGDPLTKDKLIELYNSKISTIVISMYDGPEQALKFHDMINESGVNKNFVILRDRWQDSNSVFGDYIGNRAGTVAVGNHQAEVKNFVKKKCFYTAYQIMIDWNGDTFLCPHDWNRRVSMGNIMQKKFIDIWTGNSLTNYRKKLLEGGRNINPCNKCNISGTVHGEKHSAAWNNFYKTKT
jgi:radical SAM protein with 4Fe4S-binding SPASM domain